MKKSFFVVLGLILVGNSSFAESTNVESKCYYKNCLLKRKKRLKKKKNKKCKKKITLSEKSY